MSRTIGSDDPRAIRVVVVAAKAQAARELASKLRGEYPLVETAGLEVLRSAATAAVYVIALDESLEFTEAPRIAAWAAAGHHVGLVGVAHGGDGAEREALLAAGFDDAITGRLSARELVVRIRAVHRRVHWRDRRAPRLRFGAFALDLDHHAVVTDGVRVVLTPVELSVLRELIAARGRPLSRAQLLEAAWGPDEADIGERAVDNVILRLRRKLPRPHALETVRGVGFRLVG